MLSMNRPRINTRTVSPADMITPFEYPSTFLPYNRSLESIKYSLKPSADDYQGIDLEGRDPREKSFLIKSCDDDPSPTGAQIEALFDWSTDVQHSALSEEERFFRFRCHYIPLILKENNLVQESLFSYLAANHFTHLLSRLEDYLSSPAPLEPVTSSYDVDSITITIYNAHTILLSYFSQTLYLYKIHRSKVSKAIALTDALVPLLLHKFSVVASHWDAKLLSPETGAFELSLIREAIYEISSILERWFCLSSKDDKDNLRGSPSTKRLLPYLKRWDNIMSNGLPSTSYGRLYWLLKSATPWEGAERKEIDEPRWDFLPLVHRAKVPSMCSFCKEKKSASKKMFICQVCGIVTYCSKEHQKKGWERHRFMCFSTRDY